MRDKYIKIFEQELENSRAIMGDCEKAVINALEDAWLGISRDDRETIKPYTDAIMTDACDGSLEVIYNHADNVVGLPAEKDAAVEHKIETMLYQALKYGAYVFYRTGKWRADDRMYVLRTSGGEIISLSGRDAKAAYKSKICAGLVNDVETEPEFVFLSPKVPQNTNSETRKREQHQRQTRICFEVKRSSSVRRENRGVERNLRRPTHSGEI